MRPARVSRALLRLTDRLTWIAERTVTLGRERHTGSVTIAQNRYGLMPCARPGCFGCWVHIYTSARVREFRDIIASGWWHEDVTVPSHLNQSTSSNIVSSFFPRLDAFMRRLALAHNLAHCSRCYASNGEINLVWTLTPTCVNGKQLRGLPTITHGPLSLVSNGQRRHHDLGLGGGGRSHLHCALGPLALVTRISVRG